MLNKAFRRSNQPMTVLFVIIIFIAIIYKFFYNFSIFANENKKYLLENNNEK